MNMLEVERKKSVQPFPYYTIDLKRVILTICVPGESENVFETVFLVVSAFCTSDFVKA